MSVQKICTKQKKKHKYNWLAIDGMNLPAGGWKKATVFALTFDSRFENIRLAVSIMWNRISLTSAVCNTQQWGRYIPRNALFKYIVHTHTHAQNTHICHLRCSLDYATQTYGRFFHLFNSLNSSHSVSLIRSRGKFIPNVAAGCER